MLDTQLSCFVEKTSMSHLKNLHIKLENLANVVHIILQKRCYQLVITGIQSFI
uniref:Uncharacterized protein n=1 Tax=Anguilla anguilla TaxID=7936 RepID=A0A0E9XJ91_ANGAN